MPGGRIMSGNTFEALLAPNLRTLQKLVQNRLRTSAHAEDLVQEILLRAFKCRDQLRVHAKFRSWLWSIAINEIRSFFRRDRGTVALEEFPYFEAPDPLMSPLVRLERMERCAWVHACMAELSERDQAAIRLRDIEDKSLGEAAAALHSSESAAKAAHFRARKRLAQIMASAPLAGRRGVTRGRPRVSRPGESRQPC
jgi:RNA polymerase sigma-70 factor (ECF subfamily)